MLGSSLGTWREPGVTVLLVVPELLAGAQVDVATAYLLVAHMGPTPPLQSARCWNKHSHVSVFTVPTKVQERPHKPNLLPGRAHLSPKSGQETGRTAVCADEGQSRGHGL